MFAASSRLSVDFAPMAQLHNQNRAAVIFNAANDSVVTDPVTPEAALVADQCLATDARVCKGGYLIFQVIENFSLPLPIQLPKLTFCRLVEFNDPSQVLS
jgi:NaMN:DMB phosphoribosyltransferase